MKKFGVGFLALIVKITPKIIAVMGKVAKGAKVGKLGLAGVSVGSYAVLTTWQFALVIMLLLLVHEYGHIWAMKKCGMKTKGIYFIPFLGGAAVADGEFPSRRAEVFIAIMGPIFGFGLAIAAGLIYAFTQNPFFAAAAGWMAMVNLFNLLPINPLDGGRIMKSIALSIDTWIGLVFLAFGLILSGLLAFKIGMGLFVFLLVIGLMELIGEYQKRFERQPLGYLEILGSAAIYAFVALLLWEFMSQLSHVPGADLAMEILRG